MPVLRVVACGVCLAGVSLAAEAPGDLLGRLTADDAAGSDLFGSAIGVGGVVAAVGAPWSDRAGEDAGAVYLFNALTGDQLGTIAPPHAQALGHFGDAVAIDGRRVVVGAHNDDAVALNAGAAWVFALDGGLLAPLMPDDVTERDGFGLSVGISGRSVIVGSPGSDEHHPGGSTVDAGAVYVFDAETGEQLARLAADDPQESAAFGWSVAIDGDYAIVGAWNDHDYHSGVIEGGAAYVFNLRTGRQVHKLIPADRASWDRFGKAVAISGRTAVIGAPQDQANGSYSGSAYVFDVVSGAQVFKLWAEDDGAAWENFGHSVAVVGDVAVVGANQDEDLGAGTGSAYLFDLNGGQQIAKLLPASAAGGDGLGQAVAVSTRCAIVGAGWADLGSGLVDAGAAYVYPGGCTADLTTQNAPVGDPAYGAPDGRLTAADIQFYVNAWVSGDEVADLTTQNAPSGNALDGVPDGRVSAIDLNYYVNLWLAGCP